MTPSESDAKLEKFAELKNRYDRAIIVHEWLDGLVRRGEDVPGALIRKAAHELEEARRRFESDPLFR